MDVTQATFATEVVEASKSRPVIVDFWAPWCGPCRVLGPVLERVVAEYGDAISLVKINTDDDPALAQAFDVRGIPAVMAFVDGRIVDAFTGAIGETGVRHFVSGLVGSTHSEALDSARSLIEEGKFADARSALAEIPFADPDHQEVDRLLAGIELKELAADVTPSSGGTAASPNHGDGAVTAAEPNLDRALMLLARGETAAGLEILVDIVRHGGPLAERAREMALIGFRTIADPTELRSWQSQLAAALY